MYFLKDRQGVLSPFEGKLADLAPDQAAEIEEAFEVSSYYVQELTWVPAGKERKSKPQTGAPKIRPCIVELTSGALSLEDLDPGELREDAAKIYPIDKHYLRRFVPVKVALGKSGAEKKAMTPRKNPSQSSK
ncbi:hypothetical protein [Geoalkalibacter halelectricus]|uniref:hypothetical protein n=1 Tax=Geoalkalibacter halelectricus TaxID=2847045 RepID=UPI003D232AAA